MALLTIFSDMQLTIIGSWEAVAKKIAASDKTGTLTLRDNPVQYRNDKN